jgi:hypothetical protein
MDNMNTDIAAMSAHGLTNLFERIADAYHDGLVVDAARTSVLVEAGLVRRTRTRAHLTEYGWSLATRLAALDGAATYAVRKPSPWRA